MKKYIHFIVFVAVLMAFTTVDQQQEIRKVEEALKGYYSAVEKFDYETIATFCTKDFTGFEEGVRYNKIDDYISLLKKYEGAFGDFKIDFIKTEVNGEMAFSIVEFEATAFTDQVPNNPKSYESIILKKTDNRWLIHYCHVTYLNVPNNNNF